MDDRFQLDVQRLAASRPGVAPLVPATAPAPILAKTALGQSTRGATATAGIASPLEETSFESRTFHAEELLTSTDGVFSYRITRLASVSMLDANGAGVVQIFAAPA